jgi:microcystin-dependent protein
MAASNKTFQDGVLPQCAAADLNGIISELDKAILSSLALDYGDLAQLSRALSIMASDGDFYNAGVGAPDVITLTPQNITGALRLVPNVLRTGMRIRFISPLINVGAVTIQYAGLTRPLKFNLAIILSAGDIVTGQVIEAFYDGNYWKIANTKTESGMPIGVLASSMHPDRPYLPYGFLHANGGAVSRTTYAALFAKFGTAYGIGNGSTTFNLPDLRGVFVRYWASGSTNDPNKLTRLPRADGVLGNEVGTEQLSEFKAHTHPLGGAFTPIGSPTVGATFDAGNDGKQAVTVTQSTGGAETRPINIYAKALISAY